jgi:acetoin utilization deacetylase AcuC-like enzyme
MFMRTYYHPDQTLHHPKTYLSRGQMRTPQEIPMRLDGLLQAMQEMGFDIREPEDHGLEPVLAVHDAGYVDFLEHAHARWLATGQDWGDEVMSNIYRRSLHRPRGVLAEAAHYMADGSSPIGPQTWRSAYVAAQCAISAAQSVMDGERAAFALCRPPGHHARADAAGGFCYLNNAAIAAQRLRAQFERVLILDVDMHHGQGIQEIFYDRDDVMYISIHGDPTNFYPVVAGFADETGTGAGEGFNLNLPMPHGSAESVFFDALAQALAAINRFQPQALVVPLGFDTFHLDPQSLVAMSSGGLERMAQMLSALDLPTVIVQEGGYHLPSLADNARGFFSNWGQ